MHHVTCPFSPCEPSVEIPASFTFLTQNSASDLRASVRLSDAQMSWRLDTALTDSDHSLMFHKDSFNATGKLTSNASLTSATSDGTRGGVL